MQFQKRESVRSVTRYHYHGIGYDDVVAEPYQTTVNVTKTIVVFDDGVERRAFHKTLLGLREGARKYTADLEAAVTATEVARREAAKVAYDAALLQYQALPLWRKIFCNDAPVEPHYYESVRQAMTRRTERNKSYLFAKFILGIPESYGRWTSEITGSQYNKVRRMASQGWPAAQGK